jgi:molecular chaperone DnaK
MELLDDRGESVAVGLALVDGHEAQGMVVSFLALGVDNDLAAGLVLEAPRSRPSRPSLPPQPSLPPPLPRAAVSIVEDPFAEEDLEPAIEPLPLELGVVIGIDLGTTNTCAAYLEDGRPRIIPGRTGTNTIPSMITFDPDGTWYVGQRAADRQILHPLRTVYGSKRLVGRTYRRELAAELQQHFAYPLGEAEGQRFGARIDNRVISMDTIAARVLDEVRSTAEAHLKRPVRGAIITVPAYFTEVQREAVRRAAREANLEVLRVVNEPTAAAVAYGHNQPGKRSRVAVWDFGGGTFDFSVVDLQDGEFQVVTTGGDNFVGGNDFDDIIASHLLAEFQLQTRVRIDPTPQQIARVREAAEQAKRALSSLPEHTVELPSFVQKPLTDLRVTVTLQTFEELIQPLIDRTVAIAKQVMNESDLVPSDIDDVLLVGGTTRVPAVQRSVERLFLRRPSRRINPDEAVALGAALLTGGAEDGVPTLRDILPMSIGYGAEGLRFVPVVSRGARLPAAQRVELDADLLGSVHLPLFQGESADASHNEYLCSIVVEDRSLWDKGRVALQISFDEHCVMAVEARHARTGRALPVRLDRTRAVEDVLRELGSYEGPALEERPAVPAPSLLGRTLGKLFKIFGR